MEGNNLISLVDRTIVKTAIPAEETKTEDLPAFDPGKAEKVVEKSTLPPSLYGEAHQPPLITKELGLTPYYDKLNTKSLSQEVDGFVNSEIKRLHLKDDTHTYKSLVTEYSQKLDLEKIDDPFVKLEKLSRYARVQAKLLSAMKEHDDLMAADPSELTAAQYKKLLAIKYGIKSI
ncbi:MAG: hypothetical protein ACYDBV_13185 [Nitrospiria bacterium]